MNIEEVVALHEKHVGINFGTTTPEELFFLQSVIRNYKPKRILEIGTASGLTTGFLARFLEETGGTDVTSIDTDNSFFGDRSRNVGYLAREIYDGSAVSIDIHPKKSALDLADLHGPWDMVFVDASHNHPSPTLDTLAVAPHLAGAKIVVHHDLQLFRRHKFFLGVGPRLLFNETPEKFRHAGAANGWNIFLMDLRMDHDVLEEVALNALSIPWTARPSITMRDLTRFRAAMGNFLSDAFWAEFEDCTRLNQWSIVKKFYFQIRYRGAMLVNAIKR